MFELFVMMFLDSFRADWPWWDNLHAFWWELPNYNTIGISSSQPGTDHAAAAANLYAPALPAASSVADDEEDGDDEEPEPEVPMEHNGKEVGSSEMDIIEPELDGESFDGGEDDIKVCLWAILFKFELEYLSTVNGFASKIKIYFNLE